MFKFHSGYGLELEVINGSNLVVPSRRRPTGFYVLVSNAYGQWNTAVKTLMADHSVHWEESLVIQGRPLMFPRWLMPIFSSSSKAVRLEIHASFETVPLGQGELVGGVETTLQELLAHDTPFEIQIPVAGPRCPSLRLRARRVKLSRLAGHGTTLDHHQIRPRARNVVIFGECGSGKSSVVNAILQNERAHTSGDAVGCTSHHERHEVYLSGERFVLFDTVGLGEGTKGTMPAAEAEENLTSLLRELMSPGLDGIDLLVYCVRASRGRRPSLHYYDLFYSRICQSKVPIVVVVTELENYRPTMESWWEKQPDYFQKLGMFFKDHACVTTLRRDVDEARIGESCEDLRRLILNNCCEWMAGDR